MCFELSHHDESRWVEGELGRARVRASLFGERERERSRNVEGLTSSVWDKCEWPRGDPNEKCIEDSSSPWSSTEEIVEGALVGVNVDELRGEETRGVVDVKSVWGEGEVNEDWEEVDGMSRRGSWKQVSSSKNGAAASIKKRKVPKSANYFATCNDGHVGGREKFLQRQKYDCQSSVLTFSTTAEPFATISSALDSNWSREIGSIKVGAIWWSTSIFTKDEPSGIVKG